jgi:cell division protein FtsB
MNIKTIFSTIIIIILVIFIRNISLSIYTLIKNEDTVNTLKTQLEEEKREKAFLTQRLSEVKTDGFVEKEARGKLGLTRENEYQVFVAPPNTITSDLERYTQPNWKKWIEVFRF